MKPDAVVRSKHGKVSIKEENRATTFEAVQDDVLLLHHILINSYLDKGVPAVLVGQPATQLGKRKYLHYYAVYVTDNFLIK